MPIPILNVNQNVAERSSSPTAKAVAVEVYAGNTGDQLAARADSDLPQLVVTNRFPSREKARSNTGIWDRLQIAIRGNISLISMPGTLAFVALYGPRISEGSIRLHVPRIQLTRIPARNSWITLRS